MKLSLECLKTAPLHLRQSSNFFIWWYARSSTFHAILILEPLWLLCRVRKCPVPLMKSSNVQFAWKQWKRGTGIENTHHHILITLFHHQFDDSALLPRLPWCLCHRLAGQSCKLSIVQVFYLILENSGAWWGLCWWLRTASPRSLLDG